MILLEDFFSINEIQTNGQEINAVLKINPSHIIFDGHFPRQPVVPGVCMMQMAKEILENSLDKKMKVVKAHEMKFLAILDPTKNNIIDATIKYSIAENNGMVVTATLFKGDLIHFKFKGVFACT